MKIRTNLFLFALLLILNIESRAQTINLDSALIAYYPFDGNALDNSENDHNANVFNASYTEDFFGNAMSAIRINSINEYLEIPHDEDFNFDINDNFTISLWVKMPNAQADVGTSSNDIISKWFEGNATFNKGYPFVIRTSNLTATNGTFGKIRAIRYNSANSGCSETADINSVNMLNDDEFHHVVYTKNDQLVSLYIDGSLESAVLDLTTCSTLNTAPIRIGKRGIAGTQQSSFIGAIDELRFYNRNLNQSEVDILFVDPFVTTIKKVNQGLINFEVFPNPNKGNFSIQIDNPNQESLELVIIDVLGRERRKQTINSSTRLDFNGFPKGAYFIKIRSKFNTLSKSVIVD